MTYTHVYTTDAIHLPFRQIHGVGIDAVRRKFGTHIFGCVQEQTRRYDVVIVGQQLQTFED